MFLFRISDYTTPELDEETAELFQQRLEAHSRRAMPGMWRLTDRLNDYAAGGPGRGARRGRYRVYGAVLLVLGLIALVPGLMEPRVPALIAGGVIGILGGLLSFALARPKKALAPPASCRREAEQLLSGLRGAEWPAGIVEVRFDEAGMTLSDGARRETVPWEQMSEFYESERLFLLTYDGEKGTLLQKKDLVLGDARDFSAVLRRRLA